MNKEIVNGISNQNNTIFVISGAIRKVEVEEKVSIHIDSRVPFKDSFGSGYRNRNTANFYEFPKEISHKILQNLDKKVKITIELVEDEDYNEPNTIQR